MLCVYLLVISNTKIIKSAKITITIVTAAQKRGEVIWAMPKKNCFFPWEVFPYKQSPTFFLFMSPTPASLPGKVGNPMKTKEGKTCDASASIWRRRRWHTQRMSCVLSQNQPLGQICITLSQQWSLSPWGGRNLSLAMRHLAGGPRWGLGTCLPSGNNGGWWPNCLLNCQYNYWGPINPFGHELET